jgi:demethylmenaquinone methyltransferase/2-methoxy-6-polyprenyl-1,4-benzoquinol methylase
MSHPDQPGQDSNSPATAYFGYRRVAAAEKARLVMQHFDTVARRYDLVNTILSFGLHYWWRRQAVRMLALKPGDLVLDVCGGTGDLAVRAAGAVGNAGRVILYDLNRAMMAAGRPRISRSPGASRIFLVQGDAERLSFADETFDAVMVGFGIRNLTSPEQGFKEMHRVLKTGGRLICLEFSQPTTLWFRWLYDLYSFYVMPLAGKLIVGSRQAYRYLPESIRMFPTAPELSAILEDIGFSQVSYRHFTNGIAVAHLGVKV